PGPAGAGVVADRRPRRRGAQATGGDRPRPGVSALGGRGAPPRPAGAGRRPVPPGGTGGAPPAGACAPDDGRRPQPGHPGRRRVRAADAAVPVPGGLWRPDPRRPGAARCGRAVLAEGRPRPAAAPLRGGGVSMVAYDPGQVLKSQTTARFSALARTDVDLAAISTWDGDLLRESRVLVPVDVQALVVPDGGDDA